jgi:hypothetical protein
VPTFLNGNPGFRNAFLSQRADTEGYRNPQGYASAGHRRTSPIQSRARARRGLGLFFGALYVGWGTGALIPNSEGWRK